MRLVLAAAAAALLAACATPPPHVEKQPFPSFDPDEARASAGDAAGERTAVRTASERVDAATLDPVAYAKRHPRPEFCEEAARRLQKTSRDKAWEVLKACVATGKFTLLTRLTDGAWTDDLRTRPEASKVIARVIASRGGDVTGDLNELRKQRIPLFPIGTAMKHPDLYRGRLVLLRAQVRDIKVANGKATAKLAEFAIGGSLSYSEDSAPYDAEFGSYSNSSGYSSGVASYRQDFRKTVTNTPVETGLEALGKMGSVDLFFEPGRQFVVLGRFDGVREEEGETFDEVTRLAVVSVVTYFEPAASIVE